MGNLTLPCDVQLNHETLTASCPHGSVSFDREDWQGVKRRFVVDRFAECSALTEKIHSHPAIAAKPRVDLETPEGRATALVQNIGGIRRLVELIGEPARCRGCNAMVYWIRHANLKPVPYTPEGLNHFIDCPKRERFKEGKKP